MTYKSNRPTTVKTFRLFKDQVEYIEKINGDCSSFFLRYLLDLWINDKIPEDLKKEFNRLRKELRDKAELLQQATKI